MLRVPDELGHFHGARVDGRTVRGCACLLSDHAIDRYWQTITLDASARVFELVDRYHASADALRQCSEVPMLYGSSVMGEITRFKVGAGQASERPKAS